VKNFTNPLLLLCLCCITITISLLWGERRQYPVLGTDMINNIEVIEDHKYALPHWRDIGVRDAVLVHIDAHDDLREFPPDKLDELKSESLHMKGRQSNVAEDQEKYPAVSNSNFIQAAARLGIVKKMIWVVPVTFDLFSDSGQRLAALLKECGFSDSDISTFRRKNNCFTGFSDGLPLTVCDIGTLPDLNEPILLTIDIDYFPAMIGAKRPEIPDALKDTFNALYKKRYKIRDATVAYSVNGGFLDCRYRWVGDLVVDTLRIPGLLSQKILPYRYNYLQSVDLLFQSRRYKELLHEFNTFQSEGGIDPNVYLYAAKTYQDLGQTEKAFLYAEKACLIDSNYCYGLPELGTGILDNSDIATAERFFLRGYELSPKMDLGQFRLAMALKRSGRLDEAIRYFKIFRSSYGPFPIDFYIAEAFLLKGDNSSALEYCNSGRSEIFRHPYVMDRFGDYSVIGKCAAFYEQQGFTRYATQLRERILHRPI
jgi:tetratricopeptide (TPR) repeat protein